MFSVFSFVYDDLYDEIPGIRSVVSPGRQSEAAAPGENRSAPHVHTQIAHRSRNLAMPQCLRDRCQRHIFRLEKIRGEGSTDRMRRDQIARFRTAQPLGAPSPTLPYGRFPVDSCHSILPSTGSSSCPESFFSDQNRNRESSGRAGTKTPTHSPMTASPV